MDTSCIGLLRCFVVIWQSQNIYIHICMYITNNTYHIHIYHICICFNRDTSRYQEIHTSKAAFPFFQPKMHYHEKREWHEKLFGPDSADSRLLWQIFLFQQIAFIAFDLWRSFMTSDFMVGCVVSSTPLVHKIEILCGKAAYISCSKVFFFHAILLPFVWRNIY